MAVNFLRSDQKRFGAFTDFLGELLHQGQHSFPVETPRFLVLPHLLQMLQACGIKHGQTEVNVLEKGK